MKIKELESSEDNQKLFTDIQQKFFDILKVPKHFFGQKEIFELDKDLELKYDLFIKRMLK